MQLTFGLVPLKATDETRQALERVATAIEGATGLMCNVRLASTPEVLAEAYATGRVNVVWSSPSLVVIEQRFRGAVPVVTSVREGHTYYHGVLFVPRESEVRSVMDLRDARAAWVAKSSSSGYIFPRVAMAGLGIEPDQLLGAQSFHGSHGAVVEAVLADEADVGAVYASFTDGDCTREIVHSAFVELGRADEVRVLLASPGVPSDLVVLHPSVREQLGAQAASGFTRAAEKAPEAFDSVFGTHHLVECPAHQLDELRSHVHHARELGVID